TPEKNGSFENETVIRIVSGGTLGDGNPIEYQYSIDGGITWSGRIQADNSKPQLELELPGGKVTLAQLDSSGASPQLNGLSFKIGSIEVEQSSTDLYAFAQGDIHEDVIVRIDNVTGTGGTGFTGGDEIEYSYSTDGGITWDTGHKITATGSGYESLPVQGGMLKIAPSSVTTSLSSGDQFTIHPRDAGMDTEISQGIKIPVTHVGTQIFGGFYKNSSGLEMALASDEKSNLFVGVGKLITALELNDQDKIRSCLDYIDSALTQVTKTHAQIGAKINRLNTSETILSDLQTNQKERKSAIEDVDFADLLTQISQQQTVYQAILKSASMIMKVSLVNYV
ncbi:flagellin, partial [Desulfothermus sp.]